MGEKSNREAVADHAALSSANVPEQFTSVAATERRVRRSIFAVIAIAIAAAAIFAGFKFVLGVALGGALALLNYNWLQSSLRAVLTAGSEKAPPGTTMKFVLRWLVIAAVAYVAHSAGYFDAVAIIVGLLAPAPAVMIEAAYAAYKIFAHNGE